jgi:IS4 transposase
LFAEDTGIFEKEGRTKHEEHLDIRFTTVEIKKSSKSTDKNAPDKIKVNAIELRENPISVKEGEKPIYWLLLTTHKVETLEDAIQIVGWYVRRWHIEQLFRTLKSQGLIV